ncbi:hypothetical protein SAMN05216339_107113 [Nitrosomonas eutropha]|uniref:Uncharacterized protein n=1 Tax=Nitrosomonas eutropha TaxID=916 RepID=A0A1I7I875_9PROT|nr:hypothetical protein [Nitrosomonas eutropha]SFU69175.1 hypothetical protein SAMN05216339_107113 [Nitrosomonas eutropha]
MPHETVFLSPTGPYQSVLEGVREMFGLFDEESELDLYRYVSHMDNIPYF